ncbi:MAG: type II secretion system F family protein [bacterium]
MNSFTYNALTKEGREIKGVLTAQTRQEALGKLQREGYIVVDIEGDRRSTPLPPRINKGKVTLLIRQLSSLMEGGLPLYKGLTILANQYKDEGIKSIIEQIKEAVRKGSHLSDALSNHKTIFPGLLIGMVKAGEASGQLEEALSRFAVYAEREEDLKNKVKTIMIYPILISVMTLASIFFILTFVIPRMVIIYEALEQILPLPTRLLILASSLLGKFWWIGLIFILLLIISLKACLKTRNGRRTFDRLKLRIPLVGEILNKFLISRLALTLGTLIRSGVPVLEAISITRETIGNEYVSSGLDNLRQGVKEGKGIAEQLTGEPLFSDQLTQMVACGEESGNLEEMLIRSSNIYEREAENSLKRLMILLEPAMIIMMVLVVGFVVVAMLLPLCSLKFGEW